MKGKYSKHLLLVWFSLVFAAGLVAGTGPGYPPKSNARIHYLGIGQNVLFTLQEDSIYSDYSCSDVRRVEKHLLKRAKGKDSFHSIKKCGKITRKEILNAFQYMNQNSEGKDYFVFYYGGYTHKVQKGNQVFTAFFISPPALTSSYDTLKNIDSNLYFTIEDLRLWMNAIPPRNQVVLIEAGFTNELKKEFARMLVESDVHTGILENRKRVLLFPQGIGIEDFKLKSGQFTWIMTNGLDTSHWNILDVFDEDKSDEYEYACWRSYVNVNNTGLNAGKGINLIKEWELQELIASGSDIKMRGENIDLGPKKHSTERKDTVPRFFAFMVATNRYKYMDELSNPIFDAQTLGELLSAKYGFHTRYLFNVESNEQFRSELQHFTDSVNFGPRDELLVFIAGHGVYNALDGYGYIAFGNSHKGLVSEMQEQKNLVNLLDNRPCKKIMLILDVCYGGMLSQGLWAQSDPRLCNGNGTYPAGTWPYVGNMTAKVAKHLNCSNRAYLTSGGYEYVSDGTPGAHSPFADVLIKSLETSIDDFLTSEELSAKVKKNINNNLTPQLPTSGKFGMDNNSTDFIFVRRN